MENSAAKLRMDELGKDRPTSKQTPKSDNKTEIKLRLLVGFL